MAQLLARQSSSAAAAQILTPQLSFSVFFSALLHLVATRGNIQQLKALGVLTFLLFNHFVRYYKNYREKNK